MIDKIINKLIGLEKDAFLHTLCCLIPSALLIGIFKHFLPVLLVISVTVILVGLVGVWKEVVRDWWQKKGDPSWSDLMYDGIGLGLGILLGVL